MKFTKVAIACFTHAMVSAAMAQASVPSKPVSAPSATASTPVPAMQTAPLRDEFFWLGEINKATLVINTQQGLIDKAQAPQFAAAIKKVLEAGAASGAARPATVISFEPLLIKEAGQGITMLHVGRSSQDMHATFRAAIMRDDLISLAEQLNKTISTLVNLAEKHTETVVPNYTNGVAAQPNTLGHYLLGHAAGLDRDAQRIREAYARIDRSAMGTTVLNGTSWPLDRTRMSDYLGFTAPVENAYDASQISSAEHPIEVGAIVTSIALHTGHFVEDIMVQYSHSRPWMLLTEGGTNTYVSSAMPQKRNPGLLNTTRRNASAIISQAVGTIIQAHNITPGMADPKEVRPNKAMVVATTALLRDLERILGSLVVSQERALEELNSDWTASQELADLLMRKYKVPFREGHHFASEVVDHARANNIKPGEFPFAEAANIYAKSMKDSATAVRVIPMTESEFRAALNPVSIIKSRATAGGPQPEEMQKMIVNAKKAISAQAAWAKDKKVKIESSLVRLDRDFRNLAVAN